MTPPPTLHHHSRLAERAAFAAKPIATRSKMARTSNVVGHTPENQSRGNKGTTKNTVKIRTQIRLKGPIHLRSFVSITPSSHTPCVVHPGSTLQNVPYRSRLEL